MNPTKKANALIEQFAPMMPNEHWQDKAIECAIICVDEIMNEIREHDIAPRMRFWQSVKSDLQNR